MWDVFAGNKCGWGEWRGTFVIASLDLNTVQGYVDINIFILKHRTIIIEFLMRKCFYFCNNSLRTAKNRITTYFWQIGKQECKSTNLKKLQCHPASSNFVNRSRSIIDLTFTGITREYEGNEWCGDAREGERCDGGKMQMIEDWSCEGRESGNTNILHAHSAAAISQIVKSDSLKTKYKILEIN